MGLKSNIIFLDINGVLNSDNYFNAILSGKIIYVADICRLDSKKVRLLDILCQAVDARIVIISSLRSDPKYSNVEFFSELFHNNGLSAEIIGIISTFGSKKEDIKLWLQNNDLCKKFIIIDDKIIWLKHQIVINHHTGLTSNDVELASSMILGKEDCSITDLLD